MRLVLILYRFRGRLVDWTSRDRDLCANQLGKRLPRQFDLCTDRDVGLIQHGVQFARREEAVVVLICAFWLMTLLEVRGEVEEALARSADDVAQRARGVR